MADEPLTFLRGTGDRRRRGVLRGDRGSSRPSARSDAEADDDRERRAGPDERAEQRPAFLTE